MKKPVVKARSGQFRSRAASTPSSSSALWLALAVTPAYCDASAMASRSGRSRERGWGFEELEPISW